MIWGLFFNNDHKDAQDGIVVLFLPFYLWILFGIVLVFTLGAMIFYQADEETPE
jgi:hypothetical protein